MNKLTWRTEKRKLKDLKLFEGNPRKMTKQQAEQLLTSLILKEKGEDIRKRIHPTQKPIKLLTDIIQDYSQINDIILDCFGGSGSTLIACEQLKRRCFMMELDPIYCDVIIERWERFTGKKAEKIS